MTQGSTTPRPMALALAVLRISLGLFLLLWAVGKFVAPHGTVGIWKGFYGITIGPSAPYVLGAAETALSLAILVGLWRRISYGLGLLLHLVSAAATWKQLIDPWGRGHDLFLAGVPVLAGFFALYLLREADVWTIDGRRAQRTGTLSAHARLPER